MGKQAYCSQCGGYVALDVADACPGGHPRSCYRDVREVGAHVPGASVRTGRAPGIGGESGFAAAAASHRSLLVVAVIVGTVLVLLASLGAVFVGRLTSGRRTAESTPTSAAATSTAQAAPQAPAAVPIHANAQGLYPPALTKGGKYSRPSRGQQRWALATCGILTEANGERHDLLGGVSPTSGNIRIAKQVLSQQWGVRSRRDLIAQLSWIEKGGHRKGFDTLAYALAVATPDQLSELKSQADENPSLAYAIEVVQGHSARLGSRSISGWDYARYVFLCRRGYLVGYLTQDEAWRRIMPAARVMQSTFGSWRDLGDNYLLGRRFWSEQATKDSGSQMRQAESRLLSGSHSPWVQLPWRLNLGVH